MGRSADRKTERIRVSPRREGTRGPGRCVRQTRSGLK